MPENPLAIFSADIDPMIAKENASRMVPHALLAAKSPTPAPAWTDPDFEGRLAYLVYTEDLAILQYAQVAMILETGQVWAVKEMMDSHNCPFLKEMEEAARAVDEFVEEFLKLGSS